MPRWCALRGWARPLVLPAPALVLTQVLTLTPALHLALHLALAQGALALAELRGSNR